MNSNELTQLIPEWPRYATPQNQAALERAAAEWAESHYTLNAQTTLKIVFNQLVKDHGIKPNPSWRAPLPAGFERLVTQELSPEALRKRLNTEPDFAALYERWAAGEREQGWQPREPIRTERGGYSLPRHD
jgi:hypothetical protein